MKKILLAIMAIVAAVGLVGGAFAYFSDTETSTGNTFTAGVLDLALSADGSSYPNPFSGTIATESNMVPGKDYGPYDVYFKNVGSIKGYVDVNFTYSNFDDVAVTGEFAGNNVNADDFAKKLVVTRAYLTKPSGADTENKSPYWAGQLITEFTAPTALANGYIVDDPADNTVCGYLPTMRGMKEITLGFFETASGPECVFNAGDVYYEEFYMQVWNDEEITANYGGEGISITLTATMNPAE